MKKTFWNRVCEWTGDTWNNLFKPSQPVVSVPTVPVEDQYFNPLKAKVSEISSLKVSTFELRDYTFVVQKMVAFDLGFKKELNFTDYECRSSLQEGDPIFIKVRAYHHDTPGRNLQVLVLQKWDELDYAEDFKVLLDDEKFNTMVDDNVEASFWRINDCKTPYKTKTNDLSKSGTTVENQTKEVWFWDYWRDTVDEAKTPYKEFLFVEWDKGDTGRFVIWRGKEVPQGRIAF